MASWGVIRAGLVALLFGAASAAIAGPYETLEGVHAKLECVSCHTGITAKTNQEAERQIKSGRFGQSEGCASCHERLWSEARQKNEAASKPRLGVVSANIQAYRQSFHARPTKEDPNKPLANCTDCHNTHSFNVPADKKSDDYKKWRLKNPALCGESCHDESLEAYAESIHGHEAMTKANAKAAVCMDCHTAHSIGNTSASPIKLAITSSCGSCHTESFASYKSTYHGKIATLGYANTAKCFDCHGGHDILAVDNPESRVHIDNRLETCESCHGKKGVGAVSVGFLSFQPHATTDNFEKYPQVWLGYRLMVGLLLGTFGFFWLHTLLWFYREYQDRKQAKLRSHVKMAELPAEFKGKHFKRFSATWRIAHLTFALSLMILTLTGMPLFYPDSAWAPVVMNLLGGPEVAGFIHRVCAVIFAGVFFWHLAYVGAKIWKDRKTFQWFGPNSLIPNLNDLQDMIGMFKWFFGKGPRPVFERWTYWEKFDYWAPFWGVTIIGVSGLMMWVYTTTTTWLPGWVLNVAAIFHGEEAFLAVVFLFTVHFFNNHFRPDKFPVEVVMFTGTMPLDKYREDHRLEYERLLASGELQKYVVDAPAAPIEKRSRILAFVLIAAGLILLFGVAVGFFGA